METTPQVYDDEFYAGHADSSYRSATVYSDILARYFIPRSVADVGCGRGAWLKALKERGANRLVGFDGEWNSSADMAVGDIEFVATDLNKAFNYGNGFKFDLALSVEVAEHLGPASAEIFIKSMTALSDTVLFGAALPGQGGENHIHERMPSYWAGLFADSGFVPFDIFVTVHGL